MLQNISSFGFSTLQEYWSWVCSLVLVPILNPKPSDMVIDNM